VMLHSEQVGRQDKIVPRVLGYGSRGEGVLLSPEP
jgi:hypothetical protein